MSDWPTQILREARKLIGTPYHHAGRLPGIGIDCWGVIACTFRALGVEIGDECAYPLGDHHERAVQRLNEFCTEAGEAQAGDILIFRATRFPLHCGFDNGAGGLIHVFNGGRLNRVAETPMPALLASALTHRFRYEGGLWQPSS
ncbi:MAG: C40 family peptidase [Armatimonadetes bacterium]|nr:C40 family peptidase [Armatimonadota bacterium]